MQSKQTKISPVCAILGQVVVSIRLLDGTCASIQALESIEFPSRGPFRLGVVNETSTNEDIIHEETRIDNIRVRPIKELKRNSLSTVCRQVCRESCPPS